VQYNPIDCELIVNAKMMNSLSALWCAIVVAFAPVACSDVQLFDSENRTPARRSLQKTTEYTIAFNSVANTANNVSISFNHGIGDGSPTGKFEIFVKTGIATTSQYNLTCFSQGGILFSGTGISSQTSSIGTSSSTFDFSFDDKVNETDPFYFGGVNTEVEGNAQLILCVKFTLTEDVGGSTIDVNYREAAIAIDLTLDGVLDPNSAMAFVVSAADIIVNSEGTIDYTAKADLCTGFTDTPVPGVPIPICIKALDFPLSRIISVQDLSFRSGSITQDIISGGEAATGAENFYGLIPSGDDCVVNECIQYDVLVYAIFATGADLQVDILGNVVLGIGSSRRTLRARLEPSRSLEEVVQRRSFQSTIFLPGLLSDSIASISIRWSWSLPVLTLGAFVLSVALR
jgi:hypothetical protein